MEAKWYTVRVQTNREKSVAERVKQEMEKTGSYGNYLVPTERVYFTKNGKKMHRDKVIYPGYIFLESDNVSLLQDLLKYIPGNTGILKSKDGQPSFLKKNEVERMILEKESDKLLKVDNYSIGDEVTIIGGPFNEFKGKIEEINKDKNKVKVNVMIFGRSTPVDLNIDQIKKLTF